MSEKKETYKLFNLPWFCCFCRCNSARYLYRQSTKGHVWLLRVHDRAGHDSL